MTKKSRKPDSNLEVHYETALGDIASVIDAAKRSAARSINSIMTATYWLVGRRIVEYEQKGEKRAVYGEELLERLSVDLGKRYGRGFSRQNLQQMRQLYLLYLPEQICPTASDVLQTLSAEFPFRDIARCFPLPWSAYVRLLSVKNELARKFYETEARRGGWSVGNLTARSIPSFTRGQPFPGTRPPC